MDQTKLVPGVTRNRTGPTRCNDEGMRSVHAIVLAGGRSSRLGGRDKLLIRVGGQALLTRVVSAVTDGVDGVVVVGPRRDVPLPRAVRWVREDPPFGGPADAVATGLTALDPRRDDEVLILAGDLVRPELVVDALRSGEGNRVGVDPSGHRQWACSCVRAGDLAAVIRSVGTAGSPLKALIGPLDPVEVPLSEAVCADLDTPDDVKEYADEQPR